MVTNNQEIIHLLLSLFNDYVYNYFSENIWKERCEKQLEIEKNLGIGKKDKKNRSSAPININRPHQNIRNHNSFKPTYNRSLDSIFYGGSWDRYII